MIRSVASTPVAEVYRLLETQPQGLTQDQANRMRQRFGPNAIRAVSGRAAHGPPPKGGEIAGSATH
ncbi:MAG: hypothetical protein HY000_29505 [Planctomycetes bacterium]|nr:hypothetical protein [Planctomycetota bacterium]